MYTYTFLKKEALKWMILKEEKTLVEKEQARTPGTSFKWDTRALCGQMSELVSRPREDVHISFHFI